MTPHPLDKIHFWSVRLANQSSRFVLSNLMCFEISSSSSGGSDSGTYDIGMSNMDQRCWSTISKSTINQWTRKYLLVLGAPPYMSNMTLKLFYIFLNVNWLWFWVLKMFFKSQWWRKTIFISNIVTIHHFVQRVSQHH
jgi:hypothetical protein